MLVFPSLFCHSNTTTLSSYHSIYFFITEATGLRYIWGCYCIQRMENKSLYLGITVNSFKIQYSTQRKLLKYVKVNILLWITLWWKICLGRGSKICPAIHRGRNVSACNFTYLPLISVSVCGVGPGFLLLLLDSGSSGQETVNTHSTAPAHKSKTESAIYTQISNVKRNRQGLHCNQFLSTTPNTEKSQRCYTN